jgi:hypothetical protein
MKKVLKDNLLATDDSFITSNLVIKISIKKIIMQNFE